MSDLDKRMNLYKSTMGQVNKLIKEADDEDVKEILVQSRECLVSAQHEEVRSLLKFGSNLVADVFEALGRRARGMFE